MVPKKNRNGIQDTPPKVLVLLALLLLQGSVALAQQADTKTAVESSGIGWEVWIGIGAITLIVVGTWFFGSKQVSNEEHEHFAAGHHGSDHTRHHTHYGHLHDPHFRKLKKKTS